jgi:hypothetical protein
MYPCVDVTMPPSEEDQYHDLIEELTYINEEPDSAGNIDGLADVQQEYVDLVSITRPS